jgi:hypothetical protein
MDRILNFEPALQSVEDLPFAVAIRESAIGFPAVETIHVIAILLVLSSIAAVDLRLVGLKFRDLPAETLIARLLPATWVAFGIATISGGLLFSSAATGYGRNPAFLIKMGLLALAGVNMLIFHFGTEKRLVGLPAHVALPHAARWAGALSLLLWTAVVVTGRWIGFLTVSH